MERRMNESEGNSGPDVTVSDGQHLFTLLGTTFNAIMNARKKEMEPSGVSMTRSEVLWGLKAMGRPTTVAEIAQIMSRDYQTTSQLLKRMEKEGFIARRGSNKRIPLALVLTPAGDEALQRSLERNDVIDEIMACLSPEERDGLAACLEKVREKAVAKGALYSPFPAPLASKLRM
jgi:DNA-binding MarR family transcriptional regulator